MRRAVSPLFLLVFVAGCESTPRVERERALELLLQAHAIRDAWVVWLGVEPQFDPLRGEPAFEGILRDLRHHQITLA